jgi:hypothetical protein
MRPATCFFTLVVVVVLLVEYCLSTGTVLEIAPGTSDSKKFFSSGCQSINTSMNH